LINFFRKKYYLSRKLYGFEVRNFCKPQLVSGKTQKNRAKMKIPNRRTYINTGSLSSISLIVIVLTILSVWFHGIGKHQTVIENSLISTSILSIAFFLFISISLYNGTKLKDNVGKITDKFDAKKIECLKEITPNNADGFDVAEGIGGIIVSIILWIIATIVISYLFFFLGAIIWLSVLIFLAMLYWIFFRALRLIFKKSPKCSGNVELSIYYGILYTIFYCSWIYGIILLTKYY
jgi:predicted membrane channel-forming protein YqfA (hemolysin III family)